MLSVNGSTIVMIRGDTGTLNIALKLDGTQYAISSTDKAAFSLKADFSATAYILQKSIPTTGKIKFTHDDTNDLGAGSYVWDIQVTTASGDVFTVGPGRMKILPDVTRE